MTEADIKKILSEYMMNGKSSTKSNSSKRTSHTYDIIVDKENF